MIANDSKDGDADLFLASFRSLCRLVMAWHPQVRAEDVYAGLALVWPIVCEPSHSVNAREPHCCFVLTQLSRGLLVPLGESVRQRTLTHVADNIFSSARHLLVDLSGPLRCLRGALGSSGAELGGVCRALGCSSGLSASSPLDHQRDDHTRDGNKRRNDRGYRPPSAEIHMRSVAGSGLGVAAGGGGGRRRFRERHNIRADRSGANPW